MGRGLGTEQNWPLVYLKPLTFNPCTLRMLWHEKMDSSPEFWQLHSLMLPHSALEMLLRSWCSPFWWLLALNPVSPCYWQHLPPWSPFLHHWDLPCSLALHPWLPLQYSQLLDSCPQEVPSYTPQNGLGMVRDGKRGARCE